MSHRTRYFLVGSALVISACLCTGLVAYYGGGNAPARTATAGPDELTYLPRDTTAVAYANVSQIMASEFRQRLKQLMPTGDAKDHLQAEIGLDVEHDIDSVVAGIVTGEPSNSQPSFSGAMVLVRGRFNTGQMEALAVQHGAHGEDYKGKHLIVADDLGSHIGPVLPGKGANANADHFTGCMAVLDTGLIALGDANAIRHGIDANAAHDDVTKNAELMHLIADASTGSNAWAVGEVEEMTKAASLPKEVQDIRDRMAVRWLSVSAYINAAVTGNVRAEARDQEAGDQLRAAINGLLAAGQLMSGRDTRMEAILKTLQVSGSGTTVMVSFTVPPEMLDILNGIAGLSNLVGSKDSTGEKPSTKPADPRRIVK